MASGRSAEGKVEQELKKSTSHDVSSNEDSPVDGVQKDTNIVQAVTFKAIYKNHVLKKARRKLLMSIHFFLADCVLRFMSDSQFFVLSGW